MQITSLRIKSYRGGCEWPCCKQSGMVDPKVVETPEFVQTLMALHTPARKSKNWREADQLRQQIAKQGDEIKNSATGAILRKNHEKYPFIFTGCYRIDHYRPCTSMPVKGGVFLLTI